VESSERPKQPPPPTEPPPPAVDAKGGPLAKDIDDARGRMEKGQRLFADEKFAEAAAEFTSAYEKHRFSAFLFNAAVAAERAADREKAIEVYTRFLKAEPNAPDRADIEKTIERLKKEASAQTAETSASSQKAEIKSLIFVESDPPGAPVSIFEKVDPKAGMLDPKKPDAPGYKRIVSGLTAPTNLSVSSGTYFVVVEGFRDYNPTGSQFTFEDGRVYVYRAGLSQGDFVGRMEVTMPITNGQIFVDDPPPHKNAPRAVGPNSIELTPGEHKLWIEAPGFVTLEKTVNVVQGQTVKVDAPLERVGYGYLLITGDADEVEVEVDGNTIGTYKKNGDPLRIRLPAGEHEVEIDASGRKAYENFIQIPRGQEIPIRAKLEEAPGKGAAVITTLLAAGCLGGGIVLNRYVEGTVDPADDLHDPLLYTSYGIMGAAGVFAGLSIFLFIYDPNEDSTAKLLPAREFSGETDLTLPKKEATRGLQIGLGPSLAQPFPVASSASFSPPWLTVGGTLD
jgi:hypothetical protein